MATWLVDIINRKTIGCPYNYRGEEIYFIALYL
jgi:hypothetical protein